MKDIILSPINLNDLVEQTARRTAELLSSKNSQTISEKEPKENFLTITEAASFLKISVNTIYSKVSRKELPSMKKNGRLYFSNLDLVNYLKSGRKLTNDEVDAAAENYLSKK